jgi:hypothetical protein
MLKTQLKNRILIIIIIIQIIIIIIIIINQVLKISLQVHKGTESFKLGIKLSLNLVFIQETVMAKVVAAVMD